MPALKNTRHEAFANLMARQPKSGLTNTACYLAAGYSASGNAAEAACSKLLSTAKLQARIAEITAPAVKKSRVTLESLIDEFTTVFEGATADRQWAAAGSAAGLKAKLVGFMRDRLEVGSPGSFSDCRTPDEVVDRLVDENGSPAAAIEALRYVIELLEERAALTARPVGREGSNGGSFVDASEKPNGFNGC